MRVRVGVGVAIVLGLIGCAATTTTVDPAPPAQPSPALVEAEPDAPALTREEIRTVVRAKISSVRACYEAALAEQAELRGRISFSFTIGPDGRLRDVGIADDELGHGVATCIQTSMLEWQFPRPVGGVDVHVNYPFDFHPADLLREAGLPRVEGTLDPEQVGAVFSMRRSEVDPCVAGEGRVLLAFEIDDGGSVDKIAALESSLDAEATRCVVRVVAGWPFPPAAQGDRARVNHELAW